MKKIIFALSLLLLCSCSYLDVVPEGKATEEDIWKTEEQAENYRYYMQTYMPNLIGYDWSPDQFARRRFHNGCARHDLLLFEQEPPLQRGDVEQHLFRPLGAEQRERRYHYDIYRGIRYCYYMLDNVYKCRHSPRRRR